MKRSLGLLCTLALVADLVACGKNGVTPLDRLGEELSSLTEEPSQYDPLPNESCAESELNEYTSKTEHKTTLSTHRETETLTLFPKGSGSLSSYQQRPTHSVIGAEKIASAIEEGDIAALEALMCLNIKENVEDLPDKIGELMDAIEGDINEITWKSGGGSYFERHEKGRQIVQAGVDISITTTEGTYLVAVWWETVNTFKPEETGIRNIALCDPDLSLTDGYLLVRISATEGIGEWHD